MPPLPPAPAFDPSKPSFALSEVRQHATDESAWIVVRGQVYDCTPFLRDHPGGADSILIEAGADCTESFEAVHSAKAWKMLEKWHIGQLRPSSEDSADASASATDDGVDPSARADAAAPEVVKLDSNGRKIALYDRKQMLPFTLTEKRQLSPDRLPSPLPLPLP